MSKVNLNLLLVNQSIGGLFNEVIKETSKISNVDIFYGSTTSLIKDQKLFFKSIKYSNKSLIKRLITWLVFTIHLLLFLSIKSKKYNNILFVTNPPFSPLIGLFTKNSYSILIYDLYPDIIQNRFPKTSKLLPLKFIINIWIKLNSLSFKKANYIFTLSNEMSSSLKSYIPKNKTFNNKVKVINPWFLPYKFSGNSKSNNLLKNFKDRNRLFIVYSGNIGISHPLELIIRALPKLKKHARFIIISEGKEFEKLKKNATLLNIKKKDLDFINRLKECDFFASIPTIDLSIVALDEFASKSSLPSKIFNSLHFGKPIIGLSFRKSSLSNLIEKYKCGFNIEPKNENISLLNEKIKYLNEHRDEVIKISNNAKNASNDFKPENVQKLIKLWLEN